MVEEPENFLYLKKLKLNQFWRDRAAFQRSAFGRSAFGRSAFGRSTAGNDVVATISISLSSFFPPPFFPPVSSVATFSHRRSARIKKLI